MTTFTQRMDNAFRDCPGALSSNLPLNEISIGTITVRAEDVHNALTYLRRRFHVSRALQADSEGQGIVVEIVPRVRKKYNRTRVQVRVSFARPEQFEFKI